MAVPRLSPHLYLFYLIFTGKCQYCQWVPWFCELLYPLNTNKRLYESQFTAKKAQAKPVLVNWYPKWRTVLWDWPPLRSPVPPNRGPGPSWRTAWLSPLGAEHAQPVRRNPHVSVVTRGHRAILYQLCGKNTVREI